MIRGQPRPHMQSSSQSMAAAPSQPYPSQSPPAPSPRARPSSSGVNNPSLADYRYADMHHSRQNTLVPPISGLAHRHSYHGGYQPSFEPSTSSPSLLYSHQSAA